MNIRISQIIKILINSDVTLTISSIAEQLNVSNKTIRNDLKQVGHLLAENNLTLIKKTGVGIFINGEEKAKLNMIANLKNFKETNTQYTSKDRQLYILNQLLGGHKKNNHH